eukprot:CAMPEP_0204135478 /NCGR_PEP_ID=MMETSP0361-20130328/16274_1 /ASSEMBLY_ACC=CAM_ASM_000343 /TAXON_ID=268821 /ORGANISM="Scrippsiella Hangoei, Strain SHTV-5" /LENGTH=175 /DNA_ID=CAMNT_0051088839 /DNA_START=392 /DNA_END=915 /DNA_ORIENTATION=-
MEANLPALLQLRRQAPRELPGAASEPGAVAAANGGPVAGHPRGAAVLLDHVVAGDGLVEQRHLELAREGAKAAVRGPAPGATEVRAVAGEQPTSDGISGLDDDDARRHEALRSRTLQDLLGGAEAGEAAAHDGEVVALVRRHAGGADFRRGRSALRCRATRAEVRAAMGQAGHRG